ncbi:RNA polymerase sigma-70 factor, ECF subfamily [Micromonospora rhizosphaerae]|uniref:RNA polymerase sigma-70 factor, ECF subfamily n=1 Tax=Micromonospora rhizosphaerae TaxID=568872 RepID=A0A1C6RII9_9ACTN|nr:RNA polymerase sigma-70 factor, ECF subfamily [Micromonospora rhizosphaerae]
MLTVVSGRAVSDATAIAASRRDAEEFGVLYDRYAAQLYRYAYRRVGPELAEDVVADTFLAAFRRRSSYDLARTDARPWFFGILTREIARHRRAEEARWRALGRAGVDDVAEGFADRVAASVTARSTRRPLAEALRRLSPGDRDVLLLVAWSDLSYEEVAETLQIKIGTVRSRLHRARRKLRAALGDSNPTDITEVDR